MNSLLIAGKYLDQPRLVGNFSKAVPALLIGGGAAFTFDHLKNTPKQEKRKEFIKSISVLTATIGSALLTTRGIGQIKLGGKTFFKGFKGLSDEIDLNELVKINTKLINDFLENNEVSKKTAELLEKAKNKILKLSEVKSIFEELHNKEKGKELLNALIPDPANIDSKHIFGEIGRLSLIGLIPVVGGILGGIFGDRLTENDWKERIPNKIKEGSYQYLANIFLCNVGAGAALAALEKAKINSKTARAVGMIAGILAFGVVGGSAIANFIGKKFIDPAIEKKLRHNHGNGHMHKQSCQEEGNCEKTDGLYSERKPEALDIGMHADDIATVAVLSGLKWIEPALPILYSVSGYRAGIGYRNGDDQKKQSKIDNFTDDFYNKMLNAPESPVFKGFMG